MAKIQEETITFKFSKLVKNNDELGKESIIPADLLVQLELVAQELVAPDVVVEAV